MRIEKNFIYFNDTATTEIYTLSLHDALPIWSRTSPNRPALTRTTGPSARSARCGHFWVRNVAAFMDRPRDRSEEHTSELQSRQYLVCRLLLEKKKKKRIIMSTNIMV